MRAATGAGLDGRRAPRSSTSMRYAGQAFELPVPGDRRARPRRPDRRASSSAHEERYGHRDPDGEVVLVDIRLALVVPGARPAPGRGRAGRRRGRLAPGPLRRRVDRDPGPARRARRRRRSAEGPVVFELPEATLVLPPGWSADVDERGTIRAAGGIVTLMASMQEEGIHPRRRCPMSLDPITLQVLIGGLRAACDEMGATLIRSAYSANIKERHDCSTALFDAGGELVMQAEHIPVHLGSMPDAVAAVLGEEHEPGGRLDPQRPLPRRHPPARHHPDLPGLRRAASCSASPPAAPTTPTSAARPRAACRPSRARLDERAW